MNNYFNRQLIEKYSQNGPRYTSYPTAVEFNNQFTANDHISFLNQSNRDVSLYLHIPFCEHVCYYCGCNKIITRNHDQATEYLDYLEKEIQLQTAQLNNKKKVVQLHLGGGTPTFLRRDEMKRLFNILNNHFEFVGGEIGEGDSINKNEVLGEFSIEIDPRTVTHDDLLFLREQGLNRVSFGVQDFNLEVQKAVNRIQPYDEVKATVESAREVGYHSISADLIYGLPKQSASTFAETIDQILSLKPDRLAVFHYAHMPHIFGAQKQVNEADLPSADEKIKMLEYTISALTSNGYEFIGLDHFARKEDSLVKHQQNGTLYRNFQGYSTFAHCDLLGFGISSISMIGNSYSQNEKARSRYYQRLQQNEIPIMRGIVLNQDDLIRRHVITEIMCNLKLDLNEVSALFNIDAKNYFSAEWTELKALADDGLLTLHSDTLIIEPLGRLLIRNIAMVFDVYLKKHETSKRFSKTL